MKNSKALGGKEESAQSLCNFVASMVCFFGSCGFRSYVSTSAQCIVGDTGEE